MGPQEETKIELLREICQICMFRFVRSYDFRDLKKRETDWATDRRTDRPSYREAWTHLKMTFTVPDLVKIRDRFYSDATICERMRVHVRDHDLKRDAVNPEPTAISWLELCWFPQRGRLEGSLETKTSPAKTCSNKSQSWPTSAAGVLYWGFPSARRRERHRRSHPRRSSSRRKEPTRPWFVTLGCNWSSL